MTWIDFWKNLIIALIPASVIAIAAVISLKQFYSQKWWEKKSETYSAISGDLSNLFFCVKELCAELDGEKEFGDHRRNTLCNEYGRRYDSLKKTAAGGAYIISKEVSEELEGFIKNLESNYHHSEKEPLSDYYGRDYDLIETFKNNFNNLAKNDLNVYGLREKWRRIVKTISDKRQKRQEFLNKKKGD